MAPPPNAPTAARAAPANARITEAPSAHALELRLRAAAGLEPRATSLRIQTCATSCINSVVTKWTQCSLGDYACECQQKNSLIIQDNAMYCVEMACPFDVANGTFRVSRRAW